MKATYSDVKTVSIEPDGSKHIRVRDLYEVLGKLPNGAIIQHIERTNLYGITLRLLLDGGTLGD
jgi:hypothetical protein